MEESITDIYSEGLKTPLAYIYGEDLPENIIEIEKVVGEATLRGEIDMVMGPQGETAQKLEALLRSKNVMPIPAFDFNELTQKICHRFFFGNSSWDFGLGDKRAKDLATYQRLKDRPSVKKLVDTCGLQGEVFLVLNHIDAIDKEVAKGKTFDEIYHSIIYFDDVTPNHAFLNYLEEHFNTEIKSQKQLLELAKITRSSYEEYAKDIKESEDFEEEELMSKDDFIKSSEATDCCYLMAISSRYAFTLEKILSEGGKYKDLLAVNYKAFGFPDEWEYPYDVGSETDKIKKWSRDTSKEGFIRKAIYFHFHLGETVIKRVPLREVANLIEAPYGEVLKASRVYSRE